MSRSTKILAASKKHTVNIMRDMTVLVDDEAKRDFPGEPLARSMMVRKLLREAINARRKFRGEAILAD